MQDFETILTTKKDGVLEISLNRPAKKNSFNPTMIKELSTVFETLALAPEIYVVVIRGSRDLFCAGADLGWMKDTMNYSQQENVEDALRLSHMFSLINDCPKVVVAVVHGFAIGGAVGLVSASDYVIAEKETKFSLSEVRLGLIPACIGPFVESKIGESWSRALFLSAERFDANKAQSIGLVHEVIDGVSNLQKRCEQLCKNILSCSPLAQKVAKNFLSELKQLPDCDKNKCAATTLANLRTTDETQEGLSAFLEKRSPNWKKFYEN
ncbi:MAG: enoyl-CoA hydratase/isomerase family protein [Bacteriovoracaceae bacterium]|nr:enoyl-CoA hydratase/isomerase family protein [Bacteriovoracaceae bacterium]